MVERLIKPIHWVGSSKKDLLALPEGVIDVFGYGLYLAQIGRKHPQAILRLGEYYAAVSYSVIFIERGEPYGLPNRHRYLANAARAGSRLDDDLHILSQPRQAVHQLTLGNSSELAAQDA